MRVDVINILQHPDLLRDQCVSTELTATEAQKSSKLKHADLIKNQFSHWLSVDLCVHILNTFGRLFLGEVTKGIRTE